MSQTWFQARPWADLQSNLPMRGLETGEQLPRLATGSSPSTGPPGLFHSAPFPLHFLSSHWAPDSMTTPPHSSEDLAGRGQNR